MSSILNPEGYKHYMVYYQKGGSGATSWRGNVFAGLYSSKCRCGWESSNLYEIKAHEELLKQERGI